MCACEFDWSLFANVVSAFGSVGAVFFTIFFYQLARKEWKRNNSISELDLYYRIKQDFDSDFSRTIVEHISQKDLEFKVITPEYAIIQWPGSVVYTSSYFTQAYLGSFEDLALFFQKGLISFDTLNSGYGSAILSTGNNEAVRALIRHVRSGIKDGDDSYFAGFEELYLKVRDTLTDEKKKFFKGAF